MEHGVVFEHSKEALLAATALSMVVAICLLAREVKRSQASPSLWAWVIRCGLCVAALASQAWAGASYSLILPAGQVVCTVVIITIIRQAKRSTGRPGHVDGAGLLIAMTGITLWAICGNPIYCIASVILADATATAIGTHAAFSKKETESLSFWICSLVAASATLLVAADAPFIVAVMPLFSVINAIINISVVAYIKRRSTTRQRLLATTGA